MSRNFNKFVGRIIHDDFFRARGKRRATGLLMYSQVIWNVATQPRQGGKLCIYLEARNIRYCVPKIAKIGSTCFEFYRVGQLK